MLAQSRSPIDRVFLARTCGEDPGFEKELVDTFLDSVPAVLRRLRVAVAAGDAEGVRMDAHALKGGSRAIGARPIADLCERLEMDALNGDMLRAVDCFQAVEVAYAQVEAYARAHWVEP